MDVCVPEVCSVSAMSSGSLECEEPPASKTSEMPGAMEVAGEVEGEVQNAASPKTDTQSEQPVTPTLKPLQLLNSQGEYECKMCSETFPSLAQLAKHVQFHDRDRPYPCVICSKRFLSRSHHDEHQRVHTGERPFICDRCDRSFTTHHNLKRHQLIHEKEEAYRCTMCGVLFCQEHQLGNLSGIIHVLKQHHIMEPESLKDLESRMRLEHETHEQRKRQKEEKHTLPGPDENCSPAALQEVGPRMMLPSDVEQVRNGAPTAGFKIRQIAYDIEVVL